MAKWVGYAVSVNCGEPLGCYQGTILEADGTTITLTKAFRNGFPYPKSQVTLNAADIKDLKIIESKPEPAEQTHSTVAVTKSHKKGQKATVCENLQANPTNSDSVSSQNVNPASTNKGSSTRGSGPGPARSKPIDIQNNRNQNKNNSYTGSGSGSYGGGGAGGARGAGADKARRRNEACFGSAAEVALDDFDFEGNLALFDKRALWERMRLEARPDVVRAAERLRPDQSVLPAPPPAPPPAAHAAAAPPYYRADHGARLPSLRPDARRQLYLQLERLGLGQCARTLVARAAADVSLRLVGGSRRLEAANAHQAPLVLALVGAHAAGAAGARCLRLLAAHGARAALHVAGADGAEGAGGCAELRTELAALQLDGVRPQPLAALPEPDLLLLALDDPAADPRDPPPDYQAAVRWAGGCRGGRAVCVCLEGGRAAGALRAAGGRLRAAVLGALPAAEGAPAAARLYLAPVAAPRALLHRLGLPPPPQAAAHPLPLYPADDHQHDHDTDRDTDAAAAH